MAVFDVSEATLLMYSFGIKCDKYLVDDGLEKGSCAD